MLNASINYWYKSADSLPLHDNGANGYTLIEVLIALTILALELTAIAGAEIAAMRHVHQAELQSIAAIQLDNMMERLRANHTPLARARELLLWNAQNQQVLPQGHGQFSCQGCWCRIDMTWRDWREHQLTLSSCS